eukprot:TRINITY_DN66405_c0_g1_i1.p1 TRINITY_DN66405_c0_g1~~TRINITY_DN66405_c0_g1_i1.p1  ORF type:complete len:532 (+),score=45.38 TRINITY_DN66405_c0_g1_i1:26-1621(+)
MLLLLFVTALFLFGEGTGTSKARVLNVTDRDRRIDIRALGTASLSAELGIASVSAHDASEPGGTSGYESSFLPVGGQILVLPLNTQLARIVALGPDVANGAVGSYIPRDRNSLLDYTRTDGQSITTGRLKEGDLVMTPGSIDEGNWCQDNISLKSSVYCVVTVDALYGVITQSQHACDGFLCAQTAKPINPVVSINDVTVTEDRDNVTLEIRVFPVNPNQDITVDWRVEEGTAKAEVDFHCPRPSTSTIQRGSTSAFETIQIFPDSLEEGTETFRFRLTGATGAVLDHVHHVAVVSIVDDDLPPQLSVTPSLQTVNEGDSIVWTVSLDRAITVNFSATFVLEGVGVRLATVTGANADVNTPGTFTLNFPAGERTQTVTVTTVNDAAVEFTETLQIRINPISAVNVNQGTALANIISNNRASLILSPSTTTVVEGQSRTMTLQYAGGVTLPEPVVVTLTYNAGTATAGDYTTNVASVTIPAGVNSVTFVAATNPDGIAEGTEAYTIVATQTDSTLVTLNPTQTTSTISITDP